jgi:hypothetical protein
MLEIDLSPVKSQFDKCQPGNIYYLGDFTLD